ncbi:EpsG family protein [Aerococcus urinae]|uniref:EpsG family protein n=1 Tax=Aerococcus urinae TaxID=1376 RepID=UPI0018E1A9D3|nr:EpsG family protein [Aerococcus urinae]
MTIYEWIFLLITLYAIVCSFIPDDKISRLLFTTFSSLHLFIIQGLRGTHVGGDLPGYQTFYQVTTNFSDVINGKFDIGYNFINYIFNILQINFQTFIGIISFFVILIFSIYIYKYSYNLFISYGLYLFFGLYDFGFSGLRQIIAMSILLISFKFLIEKDFKKFLIFTTLATLIHTTAISFFIAYPLINSNFIQKIYNKFFVVILPFIIYFGGLIVYQVLKWFQPLLLVKFNLIYSEGFGMDEVFIILIYLSGILLPLFNKKIKKDRLYISLQLLSSITLGIQLLSPYSYYFTRFNLYYYQFMVIFVPYIFEGYARYIMGKNKFVYLFLRYSALLIFFFAIVFFYHGYIQTNPHKIVPYSFF